MNAVSRPLTLLLTLSLAAFGATIGIGPALAHACYESTSGDTGLRCGSCTKGEYHDHKFRDGTSCSEEAPCVGLACNTLEGFCKDFPKVCNPAIAIRPDAILP